MTLKSRFICVFMLGSSLLAACVDAATPEETDARIKAATIAAIGAGNPGDITISGLEKTPVRAAWSATTSDGRYACDSDEKFAVPACQRVVE